MQLFSVRAAGWILSESVLTHTLLAPIEPFCLAVTRSTEEGGLADELEQPFAVRSSFATRTGASGDTQPPRSKPRHVERICLLESAFRGHKRGTRRRVCCCTAATCSASAPQPRQRGSARFRPRQPPVERGASESTIPRAGQGAGSPTSLMSSPWPSRACVRREGVRARRAGVKSACY